MNDGHTYCIKERLIVRASQLLMSEQEYIADAITELLIKGDLYLEKKRL